MYANEYHWSDIHPHEVLGSVGRTGKILKVRRMSAALDPDWSPEVLPGGFCGHVMNQAEQVWHIVPDPEAVPFLIRLHKDGTWRSAGGTRYRLGDVPVRFHDYNF